MTAPDRTWLAGFARAGELLTGAEGNPLTESDIHELARTAADMGQLPSLTPQDRARWQGLSAGLAEAVCDA